MVRHHFINIEKIVVDNKRHVKGLKPDLCDVKP